MSYICGTPLSSELSNPAYSGVSKNAGALTLSKLLTMSTFCSVLPFFGIPMLTVSDGKLRPPSLYASILKL